MRAMGETRPGLRRLFAVGLLVALASLLLGWGGATADPVDDSGYWWRLQVVAGGPLAPSGVAANQLYVAADPAGIAAIAAVRATVGTDAIEALALTEVASSGSVTLRACPTSGWAEPRGAGAWTDRPAIDRCAGESVPGTKVGSTWTFPVGNLVDAKGVLDVAIVPGLEDQSVTLAAPGPDAIRRVVVAAPATDDSAASPPSTAMAQPAPSAGAFDVSPSLNSVALGQLDELPSSGLAVPAAGVATNAFDNDVEGFAAPPRRSRPTTGGRSPLALVAVAIVAGVWFARTRGALAAAPQHALFGSPRYRVADLAVAGGALVAADAAQASPALEPPTGGNR